MFTPQEKTEFLTQERPLANNALFRSRPFVDPNQSFVIIPRQIMIMKEWQKSLYLLKFIFWTLNFLLSLHMKLTLI